MPFIQVTEEELKKELSKQFKGKKISHKLKKEIEKSLISYLNDLENKNCNIQGCS